MLPPERRNAGALPLLSYLLDDMWKSKDPKWDGILRLPAPAIELGRVLVDRANEFIAAHPDSPKRELRWIDWNAPIDAMEIINLDTSWRVLAQQTGFWPRWRLLAALGTYRFRPAETIAGLLGDSPEILDRWESLTRRRLPFQVRPN